MVIAELVVAVGGQQQRLHAAQPSPEEAQQVDGGVVGPVNVFHHRDGEGSGRVDLGEEGREQLIPRSPAAAQVREFPVELRADVEQRAERPRGQQAVAGPPQPAGILRVLLERLEERGLPHAGLPGHQHQAAAAFAWPRARTQPAPAETAPAQATPSTEPPGPSAGLCTPPGRAAQAASTPRVRQQAPHGTMLINPDRSCCDPGQRHEPRPGTPWAARAGPPPRAAQPGRPAISVQSKSQHFSSSALPAWGARNRLASAAMSAMSQRMR
jgi:hypothetical protein